MTKARPAWWPRWNRRRLILILSLGLNLVFLGIAAGAFLHGPPKPPPGGPALWHYGRSLPEPYRDELVRDLRDTRDDWREARDSLRGQRAALAEALVAQPFDPAAVVAVLDLERRLISDLTARGTALLMEQITRMSPEDRAAYAEALRQEPEPSGDRRGPEKGKHFRP